MHYAFQSSILYLGTGKTAMLRKVCQDIDLNLISVDTAQLFNKFILIFCRSDHKVLIIGTPVIQRKC